MNRFMLAGLLLALAGCGPEDVTGPADDEGAVPGESELSEFSRSYLTARRDLRTCAAPACRGYWVKDVNRTTAERYVSALDFSSSNLGDDDVAKARAAGDGELVLRGKLSKAEATSGTRQLIVAEAYRGLPGVKARATDTYFWAAPRRPQIVCLTAPCANEVAHKLNATASEEFSGYATDRSAAPSPDRPWLAWEVESNKAMVAAVVRDGRQLAGGKERILDSSQVFLRLPYQRPPCPLWQPKQCGNGEVAVYKRTPQLCLLQDGCAKQASFCSIALPSCGAGYKMASWRANPSACLEYRCDPTFLTE